MGETGVGIENEKYSLYLNFIDKTCNTYLYLLNLFDTVLYYLNMLKQINKLKGHKTVI